MMSGSDIFLIVLSLFSLLGSLSTTFLARIVSKETQKMKDEAKARKMSRIEVGQDSLDEIQTELKSLTKGNDQKTIQIKGKRILQNTRINTKIASNYRR